MSAFDKASNIAAVSERLGLLAGLGLLLVELTILSVESARLLFVGTLELVLGFLSFLCVPLWKQLSPSVKPPIDIITSVEDYMIYIV